MFRLDGVAFDPTPAVDAWYQRVLLETDYAALGERQRAFEAAMRAGEVRTDIVLLGGGASAAPAAPVGPAVGPAAVQDVAPSVLAAPAPPKIAVQIYTQGTMTKMVARFAQGEPLEKTLAWAESELEGFTRT